MGEMQPAPVEVELDLKSIIESRNAAALSGQINTVTDNMIGLGLLRIASLDLAGAVNEFEGLVNRIDMTDRTIAEKWLPGEDLDHIRESLAYVRRFAEGFKQLAIGVQGMAGRTPDAAVEAFRSSATVFRELTRNTNDPDFDAFADYVDCNMQAALAQEELIRLNNDEAARRYTTAAAKARALLENTLPPLLNKPDHSPFLEFVGGMAEAGLRVYIQGFDTASFRSQTSSGNFEIALIHAMESNELAKQSLESISPDGPPALRAILQAMVSMTQADIEITRAHVLREKRDWEPAVEGYKRVRACLQTAAVQVAESPLPEASAGMDFLLNQANNIALWLRQCDRERRFVEETNTVKDQYASFQESLAQVYRNMGVVINNNIDLQNMVQQTANITQEVKVRDGFSDLRAQASKADVDPDTKSAIIKKADEAIELADHGATFLDKAKQIAEDVGALVQKAGPAAAVLVPAAKAIGAALGIPLPF